MVAVSEIAANVQSASLASEDGFDASLGVISQSRLTWLKFREHRVAFASAIFVAFVYFVAITAEVVAPTTADAYDARFALVQPQAIHLTYRDDQDALHFGPYVNGFSAKRDPLTLRRIFAIDENVRIPLGLFVRGQPYRLWGLFDADIHLFGPTVPNAPFFLLGSDRTGRDVLSRLIYGTRISMSIGLVGVVSSLVLGVLLGGVSGYFGGTTDNIIQRVIEFIMSLPTIPLWMGLAAAIPVTWSPVTVYFIITLIISLIGWTALAREVRGRFMSWRNETFVIAARLDGTGQMTIILRHLLPGFTSHLIASVTLAIPAMIIAETSLSFLGIGLRPPVVSWGVLLQDAQNVRTLVEAPWLLSPAIAVMLTVLALNFFGEGLRDAADPNVH